MTLVVKTFIPGFLCACGNKLHLELCSAYKGYKVTPCCDRCGGRGEAFVSTREFVQTSAGEHDRLVLERAQDACRAVLEIGLVVRKPWRTI